MNGSRIRTDNGTVCVYYADLNDCRPEKPEALLSPDERDRAGRYRFAADSLRYVRARCLLREVLAGFKGCSPEAIRFGYGEHKKPFLDGEPARGVQFSISHSGDMAAIAVACGRSVGIDIEKIRDGIPEPDACLRFFSDKESAAIRNLRGRAKAELFLRIWTRKEALLKATGEGIGGLAVIPDLSESGIVMLNGTVWQVHDLGIPEGYTGALAAEGTGSVVRTTRFWA